MILGARDDRELECADDRELSWRRASFSGSSGGNCVELAWRKATRSATSGQCVELALDARDAPDASLQRLLVRDSKNAHGPRLDLRVEALAALTYAVART